MNPSDDGQSHRRESSLSSTSTLSDGVVIHVDSLSSGPGTDEEEGEDGGAQTQLSHAELHALFQLVGSDERRPAAAKQTIMRRGVTSSRQARDPDVDSAVESARLSLADIAQGAAKLLREDDNEEGVARIERACAASASLSSLLPGIAGGNDWRLHLHARALRGRTRQIQCWVNCMVREVDRGGLSVDGDVREAVVALLLDPDSALVPPSPRKRTRGVDFELMMTEALRASDASRRARLQRGDELLHQYRSEEHDQIDVVHPFASTFYPPLLTVPRHTALTLTFDKLANFEMDEVSEHTIESDHDSFGESSDETDGYDTEWVDE